MKDYAAISILVYNRKDKLVNCINSLKNNFESKFSDLYIFSDGPKKGDEKKVNSIRAYIKKIKGFKSINYYFSKKNDPRGISDLSKLKPFEVNERIIRLEDDIIVGKYFLKFMNYFLEKYKDNNKVFGISAYLPPVIQENDYFLSKDFNAWGWATWKDRNIREAYNFNNYLKIKNTSFKKRLLKYNSFNPTMKYMIRLIHYDKTNAGDYRYTAWMLLNNLYVIKPPFSLTSNTGFDGSGGGKSNNKLYSKVNFNLDSDIQNILKMKKNLRYNSTFDNHIFDYYFSRKNKVRFKYFLIYFLRMYIPKKILFNLRNFFTRR